MTSINKKTNPFEEAKSLFKINDKPIKIKDRFFINKILSYNKKSILASIEINKFLNLPQWATDALFHFVVPKENNIYLNFISKAKQTEDKILLNKISTFFETNEFHSKQIIKIFKDKKINPKKYFGLK